jgi:hypothetical protein
MRKNGISGPIDAIKKPYEADHMAKINENTANILDERLRLPKNTTISKLPIKIAVIHNRFV